MFRKPRIVEYGVVWILCLGGLTTGCSYRPPETGDRISSTNTVTVSTVSEPADREPLLVGAGDVHRGDLKPYLVSAKASSIENAWSQAELAFDGRMTSRWASLSRDGEWLEGYFDRTVGVERIEIHWEIARAADYEIALLNRKGEWVEVSRRVNCDGMIDTLDFSGPFRASGIRIHCTRRISKWGNSIYEINLTGTVAGDPPEQNLIGWSLPMGDYRQREQENTAALMKASALDPPDSRGMSDDEFLDLVERRSFDYFWYETNPDNGLTRDRGRNFSSSESIKMCSVAAVGFALTAYAVGAERGWVACTAALERVRTTLTTFERGPIRNIKGQFPHFVDYFSAADMPGTEISTIDTALFLAGMIVAREYFQDDEINALSQSIFERVDWNWARNGNSPFVVHGLRQDGSFLDARWGSFTEGILIYLVGGGSPSCPLSADSWDAINRHIGEYDGYRFAVEHGFQSIFRYQYPALWFDFRGLRDRTDIDYFENVTIATLAMRQYCLNKAVEFPKSYGPDMWGQGAADGPGNRYMIYGFPPGEPYSPVDGTIIPYAAAGSMPFTPQLSIRALRHLYDRHHKMWGKYGFADAVNPTLNFIASDVIGLDAGAILMGIENHRSGMIWNLFMTNAWMREATARLGFRRLPIPSDPDGPIDLARTGAWKFMPGGGEMQSPVLNDSQWADIIVPDRWENQNERFARLDGAAWYRVRFELSRERLKRWIETGRPIVFRMGGVDDGDRTFLNGVAIGGMQPGPDVFRAPRKYRVPPNTLRVGNNVIAVYVLDNKGAGGIWLPPVEIGPEPSEAR